LALQQPNPSFTYKLVHTDTEKSSRETIVNVEPKYIANAFFCHLEDILDNTIVSEWLLLNANWAYFQLYHGEKKTFWRDHDARLELDKYAELASKHVAPPGHIILIPSHLDLLIL